MASELTPAQRAALEVLGDGKQHGMSKRSSTSEGPARVNIRAGSALASLGLARIDMDLSPHHSVFANYDKIEITDAGRKALTGPAMTSSRSLTPGWTPDREALAWAAGFFDGEGCTSSTKRGRQSVALSVSQSSESGDTQLLDRFAAAIGFGKINGPYRNGQSRKPIFRYDVHGFELTQAVIATLWPWLGPVKREQARSRLVAYRDLVRVGQRDASLCPRGHDWSYKHHWYIDTRGTKVCRLCHRDDNRRAHDRGRKRPFNERPARQAGAR